MIDQRLLWRGVGVTSGLAAGALTRKLLIMAWERTRGTTPPMNPAAPRTTWPEALSWAVASGVALAVGRLIAARGAAEAWKGATGSYPPGLEDVGA